MTRANDGGCRSKRNGDEAGVAAMVEDSRSEESVKRRQPEKTETGRERGGVKTDRKNPVSVRPFFYISSVFLVIQKRDGKST